MPLRTCSDRSNSRLGCNPLRWDKCSKSKAEMDRPRQNSSRRRLPLPEDQQKEDREALARLQQDTKIYPALQRLLAKLNEDAITKWTNGEDVKKAWLRGYRECLDDLRGAVEQMAVDAQDDAAEEQHGKEI